MGITHNLRILEDLVAPGAVYAAAGHVLVLDGYTACIYTAEDASALSQAWAEGIDAGPDGDNGDGYEAGQAYTRACAQATALRDEDVTEAVREALQEASGIRGRMTYGW
jgi:hypothetical protein